MQFNIISIITAIMAAGALATHELGSTCSDPKNYETYGCSNDECSVVSAHTLDCHTEIYVDRTKYRSNVFPRATALTTGPIASLALGSSARTAPATLPLLRVHALPNFHIPENKGAAGEETRLSAKLVFSHGNDADELIKGNRL